MSFECECPVSALRFFTLASRTVPSRSPQPIYEHVLVSASGNVLEIVSVSPEMAETRCRLRLDNIRGHGGIAVPADLMNDIIAALPPSENIVMFSDDKALNIRWKSGEGKISGITEDKFPPRLMNTKDVREILVEAKSLATAARRVVVASGKPGRVKDVYTGVSLRYSSLLELAATDTYRLAVDRLEARSANGEGISVVLPSKIVADWGRISEESTSGDVRIVVGDRFATLVVSTEIAEIFSTSAFLPGSFPDYSALIPPVENRTTRISAPTGLLVNVCRLILATVTDKTVAIGLQCNRSGLLINAVGTTSKFSVNLPAEVIGNIEAVFDARLFADGVESLCAKTTIIELTSPCHPCVIRGDGEEFQYVLMPMVLQQ